MKVINNRTELLSLINENFNYLMTNGFQIVEISISSDSKSWAVVFDGKCKIRIEWNWHDALCIAISRSGENNKQEEYGVIFLAYFLLGRESVEKFFDETRMSYYNDIRAYSQFLLTHLDNLINFVTDDNLEQRTLKLKQSHKEYLDLHHVYFKKYM